MRKMMNFLRNDGCCNKRGEFCTENDGICSGSCTNWTRGRSTRIWLGKMMNFITKMADLGIEIVGFVLNMFDLGIENVETSRPGFHNDFEMVRFCI